MAYADFKDPGQGTISPATYSSIPRSDPADSDGLTALEWRVVAIARNDGRASLRPARRLATLLRAVFKQTNPRLADTRLEALRRMAVITWHDGYAVPSGEVYAFLAAGFTPGQYETMVDRITLTKVNTPPKARS